MRYFPRLLHSYLVSPISRGKIHIIFGARQTGKSTLMGRLAQPDSVFINLQDRSRRLELEREPAVFTRQLKAIESGSRRVIVDEIQRVPALLDEIQYLYDEFPGRFEFFLTGSSARRLKVSSANLLPGRSHLFRIAPLLIFERKGNRAGGIFPLQGSGSFQALFPAAGLEEILLYGNLPGIVLELAASRALTLQSYVELYLEEEIRREGLVKNLGAFQQFLELAAMESGKVINLTAISRQSGIPVATLRTFYQVLEDTFTGYRIPAFGGSSRQRVLRTPKFLLFDPGVRNAAARLSFSDTLLRTQGGQLFENWVGLELMHRCLFAGRTYRLSFWRTALHAEVDYILETPSEVIPIEVKWTRRPHESAARHLKQFLKLYPDRAKRGYLVCRCEQRQQISENIQAIPWQEL